MKFWILAVVLACVAGIGCWVKSQLPTGLTDSDREYLKKYIDGYPSPTFSMGNIRCLKCNGEFVTVTGPTQVYNQYIWYGQCRHCHTEFRWVGDSDGYPVSVEIAGAQTTETNSSHASSRDVPPPAASAGGQNNDVLAIVWRDSPTGVYPACPYCRLEVVHDKAATACPHCGRDIRWVTAPCPHCGGDLKVTCPHCHGAGNTPSGVCLSCAGKGRLRCGQCGNGVVGD